MPMSEQYADPAPTRAEVDALNGPTLLEFGAPWCGHCQAAQPLLAEAFVDYPSLRHIKIEDGSGLPLGRSFKVKLWPTLVFLRDGHELSRLVRPIDVGHIRQAIVEILSAPKI